MVARDEPSRLEGAARALLLARQDVEVVLAGEPAWQALQHIEQAGEANGSRERDLVIARLALVPAYRALTRVNESLQELAGYVAGQSADRGNNWSGDIGEGSPSLQQIATEFRGARKAHDAASEAPTLSGWQSRTESGSDGISQPMDLDRLIALIRRGTKDRWPQPLQGLLASLTGGVDMAASRPAGSATEARPFPDRVADPDAAASMGGDQAAIELVPVSAAAASKEEAVSEIVVEQTLGNEGPAALAAPPTTFGATSTFERLDRMEAEIDVLANGVARPLPPRPPGFSLPPNFDPSRVDLDEAMIEIVRKPASDTVDTAEPVPPVAASHRPISTGDPAMGEEATVEIIGRDLNADVPASTGVAKDAGEPISAGTGVRRFMSAWSIRDRR